MFEKIVFESTRAAQKTSWVQKILIFLEVKIIC